MPPRLPLAGGTIIGAQRIVTAAHNFDSIGSEELLQRGWVRAGSSTWQSGGHVRNISRVIIHKGYNRSLYLNDIAIVVLSTPLQLGVPGVRRIDVSFEPNGAVQPNTEVRVSGWGHALRGPRPPFSRNLQVVSLRSISVADCVQLFAARGVNITDAHLCTLPQSLRGPCVGDTGGESICVSMPMAVDRHRLAPSPILLRKCSVVLSASSRLGGSIAATACDFA